MTLIGRGGMGEVYRAHDTKLGRDVAIKILPPVFTTDRERVARFEREARVLAALNHPQIGAIYGVEEAKDVRGLVLELVEGPTLADRLKAEPVPMPEIVAIARQIIEALDAAHEKGIVHRDLKPSNIKITSEIAGWRGADVEIRCAQPEDGPSRAIARVTPERAPFLPLLAQIALSPDGRAFAIPMVDGATTNLWTISTADGAMNPLTDFGDRSILMTRSVSWSADGQFLHAAVAEYETDIVLIDGLLP